MRDPSTAGVRAVDREAVEVLREGDEVFGAIGAGQGGDDRGLGRVTPVDDASGASWGLPLH